MIDGMIGNDKHGQGEEPGGQGLGLKEEEQPSTGGCPPLFAERAVTAVFGTPNTRSSRYTAPTARTICRSARRPGRGAADSRRKSPRRRHPRCRCSAAQAASTMPALPVLRWTSQRMAIIAETIASPTRTCTQRVTPWSLPSVVGRGNAATRWIIVTWFRLYALRGHVAT